MKNFTTAFSLVSQIMLIIILALKQVSLSHYLAQLY